MKKSGIIFISVVSLITPEFNFLTNFITLLYLQFLSEGRPFHLLNKLKDFPISRTCFDLLLLISYILFKNYFLLANNCFTMFCSFHCTLKVNQAILFPYIQSLTNLLHHWHIDKTRVFCRFNLFWKTQMFLTILFYFHNQDFEDLQVCWG